MSFSKHEENVYTVNIKILPCKKKIIFSFHCNRGHFNFFSQCSKISECQFLTIDGTDLSKTNMACFFHAGIRSYYIMQMDGHRSGKFRWIDGSEVQVSKTKNKKQIQKKTKQKALIHSNLFKSKIYDICYTL